MATDRSKPRTTIPSAGGRVRAARPISDPRVVNAIHRQNAQLKQALTELLQLAADQVIEDRDRALAHRVVEVAGAALGKKAGHYMQDALVAMEG